MIALSGKWAKAPLGKAGLSGAPLARQAYTVSASEPITISNWPSPFTSPSAGDENFGTQYRPNLRAPVWASTTQSESSQAAIAISIRPSWAISAAAGEAKKAPEAPGYRA